MCLLNVHLPLSFLTSFLSSFVAMCSPLLPFAFYIHFLPLIVFHSWFTLSLHKYNLLHSSARRLPCQGSCEVDGSFTRRMPQTPYVHAYESKHLPLIYMYIFLCLHSHLAIEALSVALSYVCVSAFTLMCGIELKDNILILISLGSLIFILFFQILSYYRKFFFYLHV